MRKISFWLFCLTAAWGAAVAAEYPIALVSDPPPAIDGTAERLTKLPTFKAVGGVDHVTFGKQNYSGAADLAAETVIAYDKNYLYVAAKVIDDQHKQLHCGKDLWKGDHLMLVVDHPRQKPDRAQLNKVWRIGLSPGDFASLKPEAYIWSPVNKSAAAIRVAAQKNPDGYTIEAAIPWTLLQITPSEGKEMNVDLLISDSDGDFQDTLLSMSGRMSASKQPHDPARLLLGVLANANGKIDPAKRQSSEEFAITGELRVPHLQSIKINIPDEQAAKLKELIVKSRIQFRSTGGATYLMQLKFNGKVLGHNEVRNRDLKTYFRHYIINSANSQNIWYTAYSPNFDMKKNEPFRSGGVTIDPYEFRFDVSKLVKKSGNVLEVIHAKPMPKQAPMTVQVSGSYVISPKLSENKVLKPAPTGKLPLIKPVPALTKPLYQAKLTAGGALEIIRNNSRQTVQSFYSTRTPGWAALAAKNTPAEWKTFEVKGNTFKGSTAEFSIERKIICRNEQISVVDKITNLTGDILPVMYRHEWQGFPQGEFRAAGYTVNSNNYLVQSGEHPVAAMLAGNQGGAICAEDDLSRAQALLFRRGSVIGLENRYLVLTPGRSVEVEYSFYPLEKPDYFLLVNRIRRYWQVNFTIESGGAFVPARQLAKLNDVLLKKFIEGKSLEKGYHMDDVPVINKIVTHGSRFKEVNMEQSRIFRQRLKKLYPAAKSSIYFHCFIANGSRDREEFAADAVKTVDGIQCDYAGGNYPIFLPVEGSAFAKRQEELLEARYALGIEGIFWDEMAYSMYKYDYNPNHWDGCSAQIDPVTHKMIRKITNVTLATLPWREKIARRIMQRGNLIGNGAPQTRTFSKLHFPRFVETGSITNLVLAQLYTPIALGDHLSERNEFDAYRSMVKGLDYGALYFYYRAEITPTHKTLTAYMYPTTPIEINKGYIIGKERILTNRSGIFSWGDKCKVEVHVFNREGLEEKYPVKVFEKDNATCIEIRIPEGYSAAVIRK